MMSSLNQYISKVSRRLGAAMPATPWHLRHGSLKASTSAIGQQRTVVPSTR